MFCIKDLLFKGIDSNCLIVLDALAVDLNDNFIGCGESRAGDEE